MKSSHSQFGASHASFTQGAATSQLGGGQHPKFFASYGDPALKRSFKGHKDAITGIAFNPNLK